MKTKRSEAIKAGEPSYDTQKPCKHGHLSPRLTIDGSCKECRVEYNRKERAAIRESMAAQSEG